MAKLFTIGLLSTFLLQAIALPTIATSPPRSSACKSPYSPELPTLKPVQPSPEGAKRHRAEQQAAIAVEFLRANRADRAATINQTIGTQMRLSPANFAVLETIQNLEAGNVKAAIALLPKLDSTAYLKAISTQLRQTPLQERAEWILAAVETLPENDIEPQKLPWLLELAQDYDNAGKPTEAVKILEKAQSRLEENAVLDWLKVAQAYRKIGKPEIARSLLKPLPPRIDVKAEPEFPDYATESLILLGHELALLGQPQQAIPYLNQAEALLPQFQYAPSLFQQQLSIAYAAIGESEKALKLMSPLPIQEWQLDEAYAELAKQAAEVGNDRLTLQALQRIRRRETAISNELVQVVAQRGNFALAQQIAEMKTAKWSKLTALATILNQTNPKTQAQLSNQLITRMRQVQGDTPPGRILLNIADVLLDLNDRTHSLAILEEAKQLAQTHNNLGLNLALVSRYARIGDFEQANRLITVDDQAIATEEIISEVTALRIPEPQRSPFRELFTAPEFIPLPAVNEVAPRIKQSHKPIQLPKPNPANPSTKSPNRKEDTPTLNRGTVARSYSKARNFAKAQTLINQIPDHYCEFKADVLADLATNAIAAGQLELALDALQKSDRLYKRASIPQIEFVREQLIAIAKRYSERNQPNEAALLLESALTLLQ